MEKGNSEREKGSLREDFVFFGTGDFGFSLFLNLIEKGFTPSRVITAPPSRRGRGLKIQDPEIKSFALSKGISVLQPQNPNDPFFISLLKGLRPKYLILSDYGKILKKSLLEVPEIYPINVHPSKLPEFRGAAPIERAMMEGRRELWVTTFVMDEGMDTGPILLQGNIKIGDTDTKGDVIPRLAKLGAHLLKRTIEGIEKGEIIPKRQPEEGISYAPKIKKEETIVDWGSDAEKIKNKINALSPKPGIRIKLDGTEVKLLRASFLRDIKGKPGDVLIEGRKRLIIFAKGGAVEILELQPSGKRRMKASEFIAGHSPKRASQLD